jgi:autotransporter translocation and assembly factor TamB
MSTERTSQTSRTADFERFRELLFVLMLVLGTLLFALGLAFLILGVSMSTTPPAPYFASMTDKYVTMGGSALTAVIGIGVMRFATSVGGW